MADGFVTVGYGVSSQAELDNGPRLIIQDYPPNFAAILAVFPQAATPGIIFAYGNTIYNPSGYPVSEALRAHEFVHLDRQAALFGAALWWEQYLTNSVFRFDEELLAHRAEYRAHDLSSRGVRRMILSRLASRLSGPLYGRMCSLQEAKRLIKES